MSVRCPEGHLSEATDYCDTCGMPIASGAAVPGGAVPDAGGPLDLGTPVGAGLGGAGLGGAAQSWGAQPGMLDLAGLEGRGGPGGGAVSAGAGGAQAGGPPAPAACPHCGAPAVPGALFCEACGYDFTTGTPPHEGPPVATAGDALGSEAGELAAAEEPEAEPGAEVSRPEPEDVADALDPEVTKPAAEAGEAAEVGEAAEAAELEAEAEPGAEVSGPGSNQEPDPEPLPAPAPTEASRPYEGGDAVVNTPWLVEVWIDPDWYAEQETPEPAPSAGVPRLAVLHGTRALVGRFSRSRGVVPEVDCAGDPGVSRRHCELSTDGVRWWVTDLDSANGTFVGAVGAPLPTEPISPGVRRELSEGDRLYLGGWTRLVLRHALVEELEPGEAAARGTAE